MKKVFILFLSLLVCACNKNDVFIKEEKDYEFSFNQDTFNVYDEVYLKDLIDDENIEVVDKDEMLNTDDVGDKEITLKYMHDKKTYKKSFSYKVIDGVAPVLISIPSSQTITVGSEYNPCDKAVFVDNYDRTPTCSIEGDYDLNKVGTYSLKYIIKDSSDNIVTRSLSIQVKEKTNTTVPSTTPTKPTEKKNYDFKDSIEKFKNDNTLIGIDVSRYQGDIDFEKVKNAGCEFVMMRIGVQAGAKKDVSIDSYYLQNIENAKKAGLKVGVYLYSTAINNDIAKKQAEWVIDTLKGVDLDFPIAFDWENWQYIREYNISLHDLTEAYKTFATYIENNGYKAMLYGSKYYLENMWKINNTTTWLAHYTEKTNYSGKYIMWQHSQIGKIDGITGDVDLDVYYIN